jgi:hypothetical protein
MRLTSQGWARWWLWLWGVVAVTLLVLVFLIPFRWWAIAAGVGFGVLEGIGLAHPDDAYPPLTHVIHRYVPRWLAFTAIYGFMGGAAGVWFRIHRPWRVALFAALLGWLTTHFDVTFDEDALREERKKNQGVRNAAKRLMFLKR